jgi:hypothetical protein
MRRASGFRGTERAVVMGLDMYLNGDNFFPYDHERRKSVPPVKREEVDLGYWRKHPNLHGYIVNNFADGVDECQEIDLTKENLAQIISAVKNKELPHTVGFFFGESEESAEQVASDVEIFENAIKWLEEKTGAWRSISYKASW